MKILFIDPHLSSKVSPPSLNLLSIMTICRHYGHEVEKISLEIDARRFDSFDDFYEYERFFCEEVGRQCKHYDVIGVTTTFSVLSRTKRIIEAAKKYNPFIKTIIGGAFTHYLLICKEWLEAIFKECSSLDYVVIGEAEETIIDLLENLNNPHIVKGLFFKNRSNKICYTGKRPLITDLDSLPINDYSIYDSPGFNHIRVLAARGCPYNCSFCEVCIQWGGKYRIRSEHSIVAEILNVLKTRHIRKIRFNDSTFTIHPRLKYICNRIAPLNVEWVAYSRIGDITDEKLEIMKAGNCKGLYFGIESGNDKTLNIIKKGINPNHTKSIIQKVANYGIKASGTMILGFPHESLSDVKDTIKFAKELNLDGYSWHRYMRPFKLISKNPRLIEKFNWFNFDTDIPYELIPELVWQHPEVSEDMHIPIILAELKEKSLPDVPVNDQISLSQFVRLLIDELDGYLSECAQQNEIRVMNSTVERMLA